MSPYPAASILNSEYVAGELLDVAGVQSLVMRSRLRQLHHQASLHQLHPRQLDPTPVLDFL